MKISLDSIHEYLFRKMSKEKRFPSESLTCELLLSSVENEESPLISKQTKKSLQKNQIKKNKKKKQKQGTQIYELRLPAEVLFSGKLRKGDK